MSIEALWAVRFVTVQGQQPARISGGIVVFETGRIFGGDTFAYYTGSYQLAADTLDLRVNVSAHYTDGGESIFGGPLIPYMLVGTGILNADGNVINATLTVADNPNASMIARLVRVQGLP